MGLISKIRTLLGEQLRGYTFTHHKSALFYPHARQYTNYLKTCQRLTPLRANLETPIKEAVAQFKDQGVAAFTTTETASLAQGVLAQIKAEENQGLEVWSEDDRYLLGDPFQRFPQFQLLFAGVVGKFLNGILGTHYSIYYSIIYKSVRKAQQPEGSQLWHHDGGPGTCINLMFCLNETSAENGAMKSLPWDYSMEIVRKYSQINARVKIALANNPSLTRLQIREVKTDYFQEQIEASYADKVFQPVGGPGIVYAFRNNCLHAGGYPDPGKERYVCVLHIYPSKFPTDLAWYKKNGTKKRGSYPSTPDEIDRFMAAK